MPLEDQLNDFISNFKADLEIDLQQITFSQVTDLKSAYFEWNAVYDMWDNWRILEPNGVCKKKKQHRKL